MGMGFQFAQHQLGLWDLSWDLKKNNFLGNGIRTPPPPFTSLYITNSFLHFALLKTSKMADFHLQLREFMSARIQRIC